MKVLVLMGYASVYGGNFIPSICELARYIRQNNEVIGFAVPEKARTRDWCKDLEANFQVYYVHDDKQKVQAKELNNFIKNNKYDTLYSHFSFFNLAVELSKINKGLAIVCHKHTDINSKLTIKRIITLIYKKLFIYKNMSLIFVSKRLLRYELMKNKKNAFWIPNAIVPSRFDENLDLKRTEMRSKYNIDSSQTVCLMFGWNHYVKGVDIAIKALQIIPESEQVYLAIVVSNARGKDDTHRYAESIVDNKTLSHLILLDPTEHVEEYHAMSDIFLSSSRSEGFPYSILEALYLKRLIVQSNLEGTQWSKKYKSVETFESENVDECAACILKQKNRIRSGGIDTVLSDVSNQVQADYNINDWVNEVYKVLLFQWNKKNP